MNRKQVDFWYELWNHTYEIPFYFHTETEQSTWIKPQTGFFISVIETQKLFGKDKALEHLQEIVKHLPSKIHKKNQDIENIKKQVKTVLENEQQNESEDKKRRGFGTLPENRSEKEEKYQDQKKNIEKSNENKNNIEKDNEKIKIKEESKSESKKENIIESEPKENDQDQDQERYHTNDELPLPDFLPDLESLPLPDFLPELDSGSELESGTESESGSESESSFEQETNEPKDTSTTQFDLILQPTAPKELDIAKQELYNQTNVALEKRMEY
ncbi:hypothetical protein M0812_27365 [Anaeramoeba flamelloides]|uniref:WW domain-containing protein n=1 Tax=Anaeramoeba flamelloides TaxID=1746091 RepID=A0AAV7YAS0_9EUKA|nr:hypothetical protein M0812_27365 [Anaeramoeba flamelloides]